MFNPEEEKKLSEQVFELETEISALTSQRDAVTKKVRELRDAEDVQAGQVFASEIFSLQQEKLRLDVDIEFRRKKINRLLLDLHPEKFS